jgi:hypothetical protein
VELRLLLVHKMPIVLIIQAIAISLSVRLTEYVLPVLMILFAQEQVKDALLPEDTLASASLELNVPLLTLKASVLTTSIATRRLPLSVLIPLPALLIAPMMLLVPIQEFTTLTTFARLPLATNTVLLAVLVTTAPTPS